LHVFKRHLVADGVSKVRLQNIHKMQVQMN